MEAKKSIVCTECGTKLEEYCGEYICLNCGIAYDKVVVEGGDKTLKSAMKTDKDAKSKRIKERENRIIRIAIVVCLLSVCVLVACGTFDSIFSGGGFSDTATTKILEKNGYANEASEVEKIIDLPSGIKGLPSGDKNKLVLINNNEYYGYAVINTEYESVTVPVYGFIPLNVVQQQIWSMDKERNLGCINLFAKYIKQYGVNCMETKSYAESYLRELTEKGVISLDTARNSISNSTMQIFPDIKSNDEVVVLFEENTAVPLYYTTQSATLVYNWSSMWSEYHYNTFVRTSLTQTQLSAIASVYGPPYSEKLVWAVVDSNLKEVGIYNSLDEVKKKLIPSGIKKSNADDSSKKEETESEDDLEQKTETNEEKRQEDTSGDILYRVRKSADDKNSQLGAFKNLENAKKLADQRSSDGYKVFDADGNCVYEP